MPSYTHLPSFRELAWLVDEDYRKLIKDRLGNHLISLNVQGPPWQRGPPGYTSSPGFNSFSMSDDICDILLRTMSGPGSSEHHPPWPHTRQEALSGILGTLGLWWYQNGCWNDCSNSIFSQVFFSKTYTLLSSQGSGRGFSNIQPTDNGAAFSPVSSFSNW